MVQKILGKSGILKKNKKEKEKKKETHVAIGAPAYRRPIERRAPWLQRESIQTKAK